MEAREDCRGGLHRRVDGMNVIHFVTRVIRVLVHLFRAAASSPRQTVGGGVIVPTLERNAARIEAFVFESDDFLLSLLANNDTRISPGEVILVPKGIYREDERIDGKGEDVDDHPPYMLPLAFDDENQGLEAIDGGQHDDRDEWELTGVCCNAVEQVRKVATGGWKDDGPEEVDEDHETHAEATESTQVFEPD